MISRRRGPKPRITLKTPAQLQLMREAGRVVARVHREIAALVAPGVTLLDLDATAREVIAKAGAQPSFLGHQGFPRHICASVNEAIVHGIPDGRVLREGDIVSVDVGAVVDGFYGDGARTYPVGSVAPETAGLLAAAETALGRAVGAARAGNRLGAIGGEVAVLAGARGYGVVEGYGGHGIGRAMWEEPHIPNRGDPSAGVTLRAGMTLAVEPMLTLGGGATRVLADRWTVVTADGSWSAHFEHTVAVTETGPVVLTEGTTLPAGLTERVPVGVD